MFVTCLNRYVLTVSNFVSTAVTSKMQIFVFAVSYMLIIVKCGLYCCVKILFVSIINVWGLQ